MTGFSNEFQTPPAAQFEFGASENDERPRSALVLRFANGGVKAQVFECPCCHKPLHITVSNNAVKSVQPAPAGSAAADDAVLDLDDTAIQLNDIDLQLDDANLALDDELGLDDAALSLDDADLSLDDDLDLGDLDLPDISEDTPAPAPAAKTQPAPTPADDDELSLDLDLDDLPELSDIDLNDSADLSIEGDDGEPQLIALDGAADDLETNLDISLDAELDADFELDEGDSVDMVATEAAIPNLEGEELNLDDEELSLDSDIDLDADDIIAPAAGAQEEADEIDLDNDLGLDDLELPDISEDPTLAAPDDDVALSIEEDSDDKLPSIEDADLGDMALDLEDFGEEDLVSLDEAEPAEEFVFEELPEPEPAPAPKKPAPVAQKPAPKQPAAAADDFDDLDLPDISDDTALRELDDEDDFQLEELPETQSADELDVDLDDISIEDEGETAGAETLAGEDAVEEDDASLFDSRLIDIPVDDMISLDDEDEDASDLDLDNDDDMEIDLDEVLGRPATKIIQLPDKGKAKGKGTKIQDIPESKVTDADDLDLDVDDIDLGDAEGMDLDLDAAPPAKKGKGKKAGASSVDILGDLDIPDISADAAGASETKMVGQDVSGKKVDDSSQTFNVFLSRINDIQKRDLAVEKLVDMLGKTQEEAEELCDKIVVPIAVGVTKPQAEFFLEQFKNIGLMGRITRARR